MRNRTDDLPPRATYMRPPSYTLYNASHSKNSNHGSLKKQKQSGMSMLSSRKNGTILVRFKSIGKFGPYLLPQR